MSWKLGRAATRALSAMVGSIVAWRGSCGGSLERGGVFAPSCRRTGGHA